MLFSQTAEYALRAATYLAAHPGEPQITQHIADATRVPQGYLSKVLQSLGRRGLVHAQRGIGGGFVLARDPSEITVLDVINAVDPLERIRTCPLGLKEHGKNLCALHRKLDDALALVEQAFGDATLADLSQAPGKHQALCEVRVSGRGA